MYKGFTSVKLRKPERSQFDLNHEKKLSTRMGKLTPVFISETMPNDTFKVSSEVMLRFAPMIAPIMHRVNVFVHYFFVPNRLLWKDWETFITGGRLGESIDTPPVPPFVKIDNVAANLPNKFATGSLSDYLGFPNITDTQATGTLTNREINLLPYAAYYKVWYDYYRDRNYEADNSYLPLLSGNAFSNGNFTSPSQISEVISTKTRKWEHDYFTSALPWTQRGSEVLMPIVGSGDVSYLAQSRVLTNNIVTDTGLITDGASYLLGNAANPNDTARIENIDEVNITNSDISINDLRRAVRLQEWLERNALAGSRYNESIMAHFGRKTSDARLQRAEYLGGGRVPVQINEVVNSAFSKDADDQVVPPGNMAGHGISYGNTNYFKYNCEEHGFVIGIMSVMPKTAYMQGIPRMFTFRNQFLDYPWPSFAHLGEQEVYKNELFVDTTTWPDNINDSPVFGYQSRYADWKYIPSTVHGEFKTTLDYWHLARKFNSAPVLGNSFVTFEDSLQNRIFSVEDTDVLWCYIFNKTKVVRSLPYFGTPML